MEIPGIAATDPAFGADSPLPSQELDKNAFMKLLISQGNALSLMTVPSSPMKEPSRDCLVITPSGSAFIT